MGLPSERFLRLFFISQAKDQAIMKERPPGGQSINEPNCPAPPLPIGIAAAASTAFLPPSLPPVKINAKTTMVVAVTHNRNGSHSTAIVVPLGWDVRANFKKGYLF